MKAHDRTETSLKNGLGAAIRHERSVLGISQGELAEQAGLHRTYVLDLERGERNPSIQSIEKLARALHVFLWQSFSNSPATVMVRIGLAEVRTRADPGRRIGFPTQKNVAY